MRFAAVKIRTTRILLFVNKYLLSFLISDFPYYASFLSLSVNIPQPQHIYFALDTCL